MADDRKDQQYNPGAERAGCVGSCEQLSGAGVQHPETSANPVARPRSSTSF